eukprot:SAG11_NODE_4787_length_1766_cov_1.706659_2_plen_80_part_00
MSSSVGFDGARGREVLLLSAVLLCCCCCCGDTQRVTVCTGTVLYRCGTAENIGTMYGRAISVRYLYGIVFFVRPYEIYG